MLSRIVAFLGRLSPHAAAMVQGGSVVTFSGLHRDSELLARQLLGRLAPEHRQVAVAVRNDFLKWALLTALDRLGLCACAVADAAEAERLGCDAVVLDDGAASGALPALVLDRAWTERGGDLPPGPGPEDSSPLRIFSSGPGALAFSSCQTNARLAQFGVGFAPGARRLLQVSRRIDVLGFHQTLAHWLQGGCVVMRPPVAPWTEVVRAERVDLVLASCEDVEAALTGAGGEIRPGRPLTLVLTDPTPAHTAQAARERLADIVFGLHHHDAVGLCAVEPIGRAGRPAGHALRAPWFCETQIVGPDHAPAPTGTFGIVRHRSLSQVEVRGAAAAARDGWFYPGESGRWLPPGGVELELATGGALA